MKLDETTKIVSLVSAIMAAMISAAGLFIDWRLKASDEQLRQVKQSIDAADEQAKIAIAKIEADSKSKIAEAQEKAMAAETAAALLKNKQREFELAARLQVSFGLPLARAFAIDFTTRNPQFAMPTTALSEEFKKVLPGWLARRGLMTGDACGSVGLLARQVVTLDIRNVGVADAASIKFRYLEKPSPHADASEGWQEISSNRKPVQYYDIPEDAVGWKRSEINVRSLTGSGSSEKNNNLVTLVLASVSSGSVFYGTVFVPVDLSWTDEITNKKQTMQIMESEKPMLRSGLTGAEIGSIRTTCK
jgi:hypothetical protein